MHKAADEDAKCGQYVGTIVAKEWCIVSEFPWYASCGVDIFSFFALMVRANLVPPYDCGLCVVGNTVFAMCVAGVVYLFAMMVGVVIDASVFCGLFAIRNYNTLKWIMMCCRVWCFCS